MEMFTEPSGWWAVLIAGVIFLMGRHHGRKIGAIIATDFILTELEELKFIRVKSRRTLENGDEQVEYMKFDE